MKPAAIKALQEEYNEMTIRLEDAQKRSEKLAVDAKTAKQDVARIRGDRQAVARLLKQNDALPE